MDETGLPENGTTPQEPVPEKRYFTPTPMPADRPKPKTDVAFLLLGLFSPIILNMVTGLIGGAFSALFPDTSGGAFGVFYALTAIPTPILFVVVLVAFIIGKQKGNVRLTSFGKGGLIAYAIGVLLLLLIFGSCVVIGAGGGLLGG